MVMPLGAGVGEHPVHFPALQGDVVVSGFDAGASLHLAVSASRFAAVSLLTLLARRLKNLLNLPRAPQVKRNFPFTAAHPIRERKLMSLVGDVINSARRHSVKFWQEKRNMEGAVLLAGHRKYVETELNLTTRQTKDG